MVEGKSVIVWYERQKERELAGSLTDFATNILTQCEKFVDWLKASDEDGDSDSKSSSDDSNSQSDGSNSGSSSDK